MSELTENNPNLYQGITAEIIKHSAHPKSRKPLVTMLLRYPRSIHTHILTHRVFSRNAASFRARGLPKTLKDANYRPELWASTKKGMVGGAELDKETASQAALIWEKARQAAITAALELEEMGVHHSIFNDLLFPFSYIEVLITACDWDNFFKLRNHKEAKPEIQFLAARMQKSLEASTPDMLKLDEWHMPFVTDAEMALTPVEKTALSVARCAHISYNTPNNMAFTVETATKLHDKLAINGHWSPFEHQAVAVSHALPIDRRNFSDNWLQYRAIKQSTAKGN